jgi:hypothetical protein
MQSFCFLLSKKSASLMKVNAAPMEKPIYEKTRSTLITPFV